MEADGSTMMLLHLLLEHKQRDGLCIMKMDCAKGRSESLDTHWRGLGHGEERSWNPTKAEARFEIHPTRTQSWLLFECQSTASHTTKHDCSPKLLPSVRLEDIPIR